MGEHGIFNGIHTPDRTSNLHERCSVMPLMSETQRGELLNNLGAIKRFCLSMTGSPADADDLLQLTIERLLEKGMPEDADVIRWTYRVCRNIWLDELRSREVRSRYVQTEVAANGEAHEIESEAMVTLELERASKALAELPEDQRSVLLLVAVEGRSYSEVAEILDIPIGTVMSRVARARRAVADKFAK